jgi:hypothetical protein
MLSLPSLVVLFVHFTDTNCTVKTMDRTNIIHLRSVILVGIRALCVASGLAIPSKSSGN